MVACIGPEKVTNDPPNKWYFNSCLEISKKVKIAIEFLYQLSHVCNSSHTAFHVLQSLRDSSFSNN